jgi:hypothetical protein
VKAVIAKSFERIHRSNLVGMGIIPLCFKSGEDADSLGLTGHERYTIDLPSSVNEIRPGQDITVVTDNGKTFSCTLRFDTEVLLGLNFSSFLWWCSLFRSRLLSIDFFILLIFLDVSVTYARLNLLTSIMEASYNTPSET